ncbi:CAF1-domain-containing protein [Byssothecium circinans]|uniref:CAF1-domain-containing protein n=1 Tax=Byssothecium circinans TaxID=147558 RepID=A0A6A5UL73_9PLEO|nr:CAF1-domain-containing protein [Byssothecium circinans]
MDVTAATYPHQLLGLLINISEADFVSFDLELTGIPSHLPKKEPWKPRSGRKSLQDRYAETKEAADRYHILQVGITCGRFDYLANRYVLRPYNITLSPLLDERLDIEREVCIQTGAITFLLSNGFDLAAPFAKGVQYLSREEAQQARQMAYDRFDKKNPVEDVLLKVEEKDSIDFVKRAREAIVDWKNSRTSAITLEITTHTGLPDQPVVPVISRFEKRLVHQLVRAEFPDLVSIGRNECIRIVPFDPVREADNTRRLKLRVRESIARQTGFRWIFEALAMGDISETDPFHYNIGVSGSIIAANHHDVKDRFDRTHERLKTHQPVLVGHNMFTDLVYLYRSFVGELPDTLDEFCKVLHDEFPRIIDTKWLATHAGGDLNLSPTLQEIAEGLEDQPLPDIVTHRDHPKYHETQAFHEAGYDSLLTATIMLRLSAKIDAERKEKNKDPLSDNSSELSFKSAVEEQDPNIIDGREKITKPVPLPPTDNPQAVFEEATSKKKKRRGKKGKSNLSNSLSSAGRFQTKNMFDNLREPSPDAVTDENASVPTNGILINTDAGSSPTAWQDERYSPDKSKWVPIEQAPRKPMELIPAFDSEFWDEFGNTLRVFGTQESVLKIADWKKKSSAI